MKKEITPEQQIKLEALFKQINTATYVCSDGRRMGRVIAKQILRVFGISYQEKNEIVPGVIVNIGSDLCLVTKTKNITLMDVDNDTNISTGGYTHEEIQQQNREIKFASLTEFLKVHPTYPMDRLVTYMTGFTH